MRLFGHCLALLIALSLVATASAQSFPFNPSANNPTPELPAIRKYVNNQLTILTGSDRNAVISAREALLAPIAGGALPSGAFVDVYVIELADRIGKAVSSPDSHVRLNAAIVIESITRQTGTTRFAPQIAALIGDNSPAISIWGLKAAAPIVPDLVSDPNGRAVFDNLQASIIIHSDSAAVVEEAYNTLTAVLKNPQSVSRLGQRKAEVLGTIVFQIQSLLETRFASEQDSPRPGPLLDERGGLRFLIQNIWNDMTAAQKSRTAQLLIEQLNTSYARVKAGRDPLAGQVEKDLMAEHVELIRRSGRLLAVLADITNNPTLTKQANDVSRLSAAVPEANFTNAINAVSETLTRLFPAPAQ